LAIHDMENQPAQAQAGQSTATASMGSKLPEGQRPLRDVVGGLANHFLSNCTQCGKCYDACPMTRYAPVLAEGVDGPSVVQALHAILRGEGGSPEALAWSSVCTRSGLCVPACPEKLDASLMVRTARIHAYGGMGGKAELTPKADPQYFTRIRAFAQLQLTAQEYEEWMS
jgi:ferredoxin